MPLVLSGDNGVTFPSGSGVQSTAAIGVGQTWQDVTASRSAATNYTNSTGRPIMVAVTAGTATFSYAYGYVDGVMIIRQQCRDADTTTSQASVSFIVPSGSTYRVEVNVNGSTTSITSWFELR